MSLGRNTTTTVTTAIIYLFIAVFVATTTSADWTLDCAAPCRCRWISGKKTAQCSGAELVSLPNVSADVQVLDVQNNRIGHLAREVFYAEHGLINLQKIYLRNASLRTIDRDAFSNLKILIEVDLSENRLTRVPPGAFSGNDRLKVLLLNGNPLAELVSEQFPVLQHLRTLELENCNLATIHNNAFVNLKQLERLSLRNNSLKTLADSVFKPMVKLKSLALENNPWKCDCRLRSLRNWFLLSKLHSVSLLCTEPEWLKQKVWEEVEPHEFACPPSVQVGAKLVQRDIGENVTLSCLAKGDPEPNVTWLFNGHPVDSQNITDQLLIIEMDEGLLEKWINVTLVNLTEANAGEYSCVAANTMGKTSHNVTLVLPQVVTATTLSKRDMYQPMVGLVCGAVATLASCIVVGLVCGYRKKRNVDKGPQKKGRRGGSVDQEKKLLDISITSTGADQGSWNADIMRGSESEAHLIDGGAMQLELCDQSSLVYKEPPGMMISGPYQPYPPPPAEFASAAAAASVLAAAAPSPFGNIFISVSVSQDPYGDIQRYPDLLDIPYKSSASNSTTGSGVVSPALSTPQVVVPYATLPRRPQAMRPLEPPANDKLGPRVTVEGSSILYHSDGKDVVVQQQHQLVHMQQQQHQHQHQQQLKQQHQQHLQQQHQHQQLQQQQVLLHSPGQLQPGATYVTTEYVSL